MCQDALAQQRDLISSIVRTLTKETQQVQLIETHISWVLVTPGIAYKFKKAVHFDFVDFSTLEARHFYCQEELRLNRRLAADIYLGVVPVSGTACHPAIDRPGSPIEYAVKMRAFEQQALWDHRIRTKQISQREIDALATRISHFHQTAAIAPIASIQSEWGNPETLKSTADHTLTAISEIVKEPKETELLFQLKSWSAAQQQQLHSTFEKRKALGFVRECHGDLHSRNIVTLNDEVEVFDCIEFNESLRWIDVMNDIAFIYMDLEFQGRRDLAARLLSQYLQITGDYEGLAVLGYYRVQRALTRCKVALLRAHQLSADAQASRTCQQEGQRYLAFAAASTKKKVPAIMITHGYSGSGKSSFSQCLVELVGAVQLRSDIERKRIGGIPATSRAAAGSGSGIYSAPSTHRTYGRLCMLSRHVVEAGWPVIVDATFLKRKQRGLFEALAAELGVPFVIFDVSAREATMRFRIASRQKHDRDASDAGLDVLARQLLDHDPLSEDEMKQAISVDLDAGVRVEQIRNICAPVLAGLFRQDAPAPG